jgi:RNA polymerase sigma-70 factor (ECF subfamily)
MVAELEFKFISIYENYYKSIYQYINKTVNNNALAEDLAQETFIKVLGGLKDFDEDKRLEPWIFRIAYNTCIDYYRRNKTTFELIDDIICYDKEDNSPENIVLNKEKQAVIKGVLLKMSQKYKAAIILRDFNNLSYKEVASRLKVNETAVKTLLHRGRKQFQKAYSEAY